MILLEIEGRKKKKKKLLEINCTYAFLGSVLFALIFFIRVKPSSFFLSFFIIILHDTESFHCMRITACFPGCFCSLISIKKKKFACGCCAFSMRWKPQCCMAAHAVTCNVFIQAGLTRTKDSSGGMNVLIVFPTSDTTALSHLSGHFVFVCFIMLLDGKYCCLFFFFFFFENYD